MGKMAEDLLESSVNDAIINADERICRFWITAPVKDTQGQILPIDLFKKRMHLMAMRHAPLIINHNMHTASGPMKHAIVVGQLLSYDFAINPKFGVEGCRGIFQVFNNFSYDDDAWTKIQKGEYDVSIGGQQIFDPSTGEVIDVEPCEISLTPKASNPVSVQIAVAMAKSHELSDSVPAEELADLLVSYQMENDKLMDLICELGGTEALEKACGYRPMAKASGYDSFKDCVEDKMSGGMSRPDAVKACRAEFISNLGPHNLLAKSGEKNLSKAVVKPAGEVVAEDEKKLEVESKEMTKADEPKSEAPVAEAPKAEEKPAETPAPEAKPEEKPVEDTTATTLAEIKASLTELVALLKGAMAAGAPATGMVKTDAPLVKTEAAPLAKADIAGDTSISPMPKSSTGYNPDGETPKEGVHASKGSRNEAAEIAMGRKKLDAREAAKILTRR